MLTARPALLPFPPTNCATAYHTFLTGQLKDIPLSREKLEESWTHLPMRV